MQYDNIGDSWTATLDGKDISAHINPSRARNVLFNLLKVRVQQWLEPNDADALAKLRHPAFTLKLKLEVNELENTQGVVMDETDVDLKRQTPFESSEDIAAANLTEDAQSAQDEALRAIAMGNFETKTQYLTLQITPMNDSIDNAFFGRVVETGQLFILHKSAAHSLIINPIDN